jgi:hypothetical protein
MKEREILKETVSKGKTDPEKKPKKRYYKPKKKKEEDTLTAEVVNSEKSLVGESRPIQIPKTVGKYCIGAGKGFCIHLETKPNWIHRKSMKMLLGWSWTDNESK